jgi:serine/threonine-protein kinase
MKSPSAGIARQSITSPMLSDDHDSELASTAASDAAENAAAPETSDVTEEHRLTEEQPSPLSESAIGSGRLAQQRTPTADASIAVPKVCPQCGSEYETTDRFCPKDGSALRPKAGGDPLVGRVIADRYLVLALLGEGGMGRVYLGEHVKMNRQCAIKVMSPTLVNDNESLQRFAREASNAARILHPNVAAVFDYGESEKIIYLVMEYVDGESLSTILAREGKLEPRRAIEIARQIADGLHAAHELGIVHRDLKPDNVIVAHSRSGREIPKVVDFGIAKALTEAPQDALTRSGLVIGTPEYMSPEQLLGDPVDARADIYSLGCILYQMLTGAPAFSADTREQMIRRRLHEAPPHLREVLPSLPSRLDTLLVHMLARSPADRLASAAEARDQLDPALAMGGWDPRVITAPSLSPGSNAAVAAATSDELMRPTMPLPRQKLNVRNVSAGVAIGAGLLLASLYLWTDRAVRSAPPPVAQKVAADTSPPSATPQGAAPVAADTLPPAGRGALVKPESTPAVVKPSTNVYDTAAINQLARAIKTGDIDKVQAAYPGLSEAQRRYFRDELFAGKEIRTVRPMWHSATITGDSAKMPLEFRITLSPKGAPGSPTMVPLPYSATFVLKDGKWQLVALEPRT